MSKQILEKIDQYYSSKIVENGSTSTGVDWNSQESHYLRFKQLTSLLPIRDKSFSLLDYGCGYGALIDYLVLNSIERFTYFGYDISLEMIREAYLKFNDTSYLFGNELPKNTHFDYTIANGIFNVKLDTSNEDWLSYILKTLTEINELSEKGFSFNILTSYSDKEFMKDYLYYADPLFLFDYCKKHFSKYVSLIHDYPLYEFSIIVKK